jgi:hypothetical protein
MYDFYKEKYGTKVVHTSGAAWMFPHGEVGLHWTSSANIRLLIRMLSTSITRLDIPMDEIGLIDGWTPSPNPGEVFQKLIDVFAPPVDTLPAYKPPVIDPQEIPNRE